MFQLIVINFYWFAVPKGTLKVLSTENGGGPKLV